MDQSDSRVSSRQFGLIANPTKEGATELARAVIDRLREHGWAALADAETADLLGGDLASHSIQAIGAAAEFIVSGTYKQTDAGLPEARGQTYRLPAGAFFEVAGGKIRRVTTYYNLKDWIAQVS